MTRIPRDRDWWKVCELDLLELVAHPNESISEEAKAELERRGRSGILHPYPPSWAGNYTWRTDRRPLVKRLLRSLSNWLWRISK